MTGNNRKAMLDKIRSNIINSGHHIYLIVGGASPRFAYTIGISESSHHELILAGALYYSTTEAKQIINGIASELRTGSSWHSIKYKQDSLGEFSLRVADLSWIKKMMIGALDYYNAGDIPALQIVPDEAHWTIDIPDLSRPYGTSSEPVWQWLDRQWKYPVPENSIAITNLNALMGQPVTEVMRWENDQWEMFAGAGPDVPKNDIREVSLGTLLGADQTLFPAANLKIGKGLWRDPTDLKWHPWG